MKIDWSSAAYIDVQGLSHGVIHAGVRLMDKNKPQTPTIIPPGAKAEDIIVPTDSIEFVSGQFGGWRTKPFFPDGPAAAHFEGKSFQMYLPLDIKGSKKEYLL